MLRRFTLASLLVLAVAIFWGTPAWAHPALEAAAEVPAAPPSTMAWSPAPTPPGVPWPALLGAAAALIISWRRPRRALALAVVLILGLFAFENGWCSLQRCTIQQACQPHRNRDQVGAAAR